MAKNEEKSLLEIAVELLEKKRGPQHIDTIVKEVMSLKGYKVAESKEKAPQFLMDFMLSGNFVYCGEDCWDLKYRQPTSVLDKDGGDYESFYYDEEVTNNELTDDTYNELYENQSDAHLDSNDDDEEDTDDADDLSNEFEVLVESVEEDDE
jgi:DNA-directed RNA polymerase delta subunit